MLTAGVVGESGFEPLKSSTTDLQSAPFGHSGTLPYKPLPVWLGMSMRLRLSASGAGERTRTPDLLITNQLLYQLSYTSKFLTLDNYSLINKKSQPFFSKFSVKFHFSFQSVEKPSLAPIHCLTYWAGRRRSAVSKGGAVSPDRIQAYHFTGSARPLQNARHCSAS